MSAAAAGRRQRVRRRQRRLGRDRALLHGARLLDFKNWTQSQSCEVRRRLRRGHRAMRRRRLHHVGAAPPRAEYSRVQPNEQSAGFGQSVRVDSIEEYDSSILAKSQSVEQRLLRYVRAGCRSDRPARQCKGSLLPVTARAARDDDGIALRRGPVVPSVWSVSDQSVSHRVSYGSRTVFCSFATSLLF